MYALKQKMPVHETPVEAATRRLHAAIDSLTDALERRKEAEHHQEALAAQVHAMSNDRARLAAELDQATATAEEVKEVGQEIMRRLDVAMTTVRDVLATHGG